MIVVNRYAFYVLVLKANIIQVSFLDSLTEMILRASL